MDNANKFVKEVIKALGYIVFIFPFVWIKKKFVLMFNLFKGK